jgi:hypothetical protein
MCLQTACRFSVNALLWSGRRGHHATQVFRSPGLPSGGFVAVADVNGDKIPDMIVTDSGIRI